MIKPFALSNPVQFNAKIVLGKRPDVDDENLNPEVKNEQKKSKKGSGFTSNERNIFLAGAFLGAVMGVGGTMFYDKSQINSLISDMQQECQMGEIDSLKVKDVTDDEIPEIILVGSDGVSTIYDINNNKVFIDMDGDRVEKLR